MSQRRGHLLFASAVNEQCLAAQHPQQQLLLFQHPRSDVPEHLVVLTALHNTPGGMSRRAIFISIYTLQTSLLKKIKEITPILKGLNRNAV